MSEFPALLFAHYLFFKEQLERFAPVALYKTEEPFTQVPRDKRVTRATYSLFFASESLFRTFAHKKRANHLKN